MGLFGKKAEGGLMDVIRCDEPTYLIWKWKPVAAQGLGESTVKENAIRYGSSLRVKEGEVAVFVYKQKDGAMQDYIEGPYDDTIKTANFPVLSSIVGAAFGGASPFQAEIYFINLAGIIQTNRFAVPYFDVADPRFMDYAVPVSVHGKLSFKITDYKEFIKLHRLISFNLDDFQKEIQSAAAKYIKAIVSNAPSDANIPVLQIERKILEINTIVENYIKPRLLQDFGVAVSAVDIDTIEIDKTSEGYKQLKSVTQDITTQTTQAQAAVNIQNLKDTQRINAQNMEETLRIQREEMQRTQKLQTESSNMAAFTLEQQATVGIAGANALGQMGANGATAIGGNGGMNPAGMMAGMAMGGAVAQNMTNIMGNMMGGMQAGANMTPPPVTPSVYNVAVNGQSTGPFDIATLTQMASSGSFTKDSLVWKPGMANWVAAGTVQELSPVFSTMPPVPPAM